jgi:hypothetical protein
MTMLFKYILNGRCLEGKGDKAALVVVVVEKKLVLVI